jgi:hypothetical protein
VPRLPVGQLMPQALLGLGRAPGPLGHLGQGVVVRLRVVEQVAAWGPKQAELGAQARRPVGPTRAGLVAQVRPVGRTQAELAARVGRAAGLAR